MTSRRALILVLIVAGTLLRVHHIGYNFDGDELFSVQAASGSFAHVLTVSLQDRTHPPLHLFLLFLWMKLGGSSETSARLLSVTASILFLLLVAAIGRRWLKERSALFVLALCSISPFFVYFGQQARPYSFIALFAALTVFLFLKCEEEEEPSRKIWEVAYGFACAALMYSQYVGALLLLPQFAASVLSGFSKRRRMLISGFVGMLSILPWLLLEGRNLGKVGQNIQWIPRPSAFSLVSFYVSLFGWLPRNGSARLLLLLSVVILSSLVMKFKSLNKETLFLLIGLVTVQPVTLFMASIFGPTSVWADRQMIGAAVFLLFLLGLALDVRRSISSVVLGSLLLLWCVLALPEAFPEHSKPPWRSVATLVHGKCEGCDVVGAEEWISFPLSHYSTAKIEDFPDYANRVGRSNRVLFLCRPTRCETLKSFSPLYTTIEHNTITWSSLPSSDTDTIEVYLFERAPSVENP